MKMKKTKLIVIFGVMLLLFMGMAMAVSDSEEATLGTGTNVNKVTATNTIDTNSASASISATQSCSAGLDSTYTALNPTTMATYSERKFGSGQWGFEANYNAEDGYRSVKIVTSFSVTYGRQSWKANITTVR